MTISFNLGFDPVWYIADNVGRPLGGGYLKASSSLNPTMPKAIFMDEGGNQIWPRVPIVNAGGTGILFNENGQQGPFFFEFDTTNADDLYTLEVFDSSGNLVWTMEDYDVSGGSGGSIITDSFNIQNLLTNNVFWRHIPDVVSPISSTAFRIAPGVHSALAQTPANAGPDIYFITNNTSAADSLTFPTFASIEGFGVNVLAGDIQPVDFPRYTCTVAGSAESTKCVQIPITQGVQNLSNTIVTVTLWARSFASNTTLIPSWYQFFGDGAGATTAINSNFATWTVTTAWTKFKISATIPSVVLGPPAVVGGCHNDGLFLRLNFPLNATCDIGLTKPTLYLNNVNPGADYQTYDQIDGVINAPRTGSLVTSIQPTIPLGYVVMNDGTIGSAASTATNAKGDFTFPLYNLIWNATDTNSTTRTYAPVTGGRGASAIADFSADKPIQLLYATGAIIGNTGTPNSAVYGNGLARVLAEPFGSDQIALTATQLPPHTHPAPSGAFVETTGVGAGLVYSAGATGTFNVNTGANTPSGGLITIDQPTLRLNYFMKL